MAVASARYVSSWRSRRLCLIAFQWAEHEPKAAGYNNPGWPGCCRPPDADEEAFIQAADWRAVHIVYKVPIPPNIKVLLDSLAAKMPPMASPTPGSRSQTKSSVVSPSRKNSSAASKSPISQSKSFATPPASLRGRSPHTSTPSSTNISRSSSSTHIAEQASPPSEHPPHRRKMSDRRPEGSHSSNSSPSRKPVEIESPRRGSSLRRPAVTPATTSVSVSKVSAQDSSRSPPVRRRASVSGSHVLSTAAPTPPSNNSRSADRNAASFLAPKESAKDDDCRSTSSGSSDGLSSLSDSTITSEGFTDYLSDESEAELQRQAEAKAALLAQQTAEELEFKMARQQLASVDLRPPKSWNPDSNGERSKRTGSAFQPSRNANVPQSFGAAASVIVQSAQARR